MQWRGTPSQYFRLQQTLLVVDPDQQMEPRSASPQHEVEQSRGPVQEKQERLASVEVEANEPFVLSTTWSATESSPGGPTRKPNHTQHNKSQSGSRFKLVIS